MQTTSEKIAQCPICQRDLLFTEETKFGMHYHCHLNNKGPLFKTGKSYLSPGNKHLGEWGMKEARRFSIIGANRISLIGASFDNSELQIIFFSNTGKDEWQEFGGHWYELDPQSEQETELVLTKIETN